MDIPEDMATDCFQRFKRHTTTASLSMPDPFGNYTCEYTVSGNITNRIQGFRLKVNGIDQDPFTRCPLPRVGTTPLRGLTSLLGFLHQPGTANTFEFDVLLDRFEFCETGTITFDIKNILGQQIAVITSNIITEAPPTSVSVSFDGRYSISAGSGVTIFDGCTSYANLTAYTQICNPSFKLEIYEQDPNNNFVMVPNTKVSRNLTQAEVTSLLDPFGGINISSFTGNGNTINLVGDKYFLVNLVEVSTTWRPTYNQIHVREGTWDLHFEDMIKKDKSGNELTGGARVNYFSYEPFDKWSDEIFASPSVWNKKSNSTALSTIDNEDPDFITITGNTNQMYFQVFTDGCSNQFTFNDESANVRLFWTRARSDEIWEEEWLYDLTNNALPSVIPPYNLVPLGSEITISGATQANPYNTNSSPVVVPPNIWVYKPSPGNGVDWYPPNPADYGPSNGQMSSTTNRPVICFLARINEPNSTSDPIVFEPSGGIGVFPYAKNNNNVATRNTVLYDDPGFLVDGGTSGSGGGVGTFDFGFATVLANNNSQGSEVVSFCLNQILTDTIATESFSEYGYIEIGVTEGLNSLWIQGGSNTTDVSVISPTLFRLDNGVSGCIDNINLPSGTTSEQIGARFVYSVDSLPTDSTRHFWYELTMVKSGEGVNTTNSVFEVNVPINYPSSSLILKKNQSIDNQSKLNHDNNLETFKLQNSPNTSIVNYSVSPNPSDGKIKILRQFEGKLGQDKFIEGDSYTLTVFNQNGAVVLSEKIRLFNNKAYEVSDSSLRKGIYYLELSNSQGIEFKTKFLVDK